MAKEKKSAKVGRNKKWCEKYKASNTRIFNKFLNLIRQYKDVRRSQPELKRIKELRYSGYELQWTLAKRRFNELTGGEWSNTVDFIDKHTS